MNIHIVQICAKIISQSRFWTTSFDSCAFEISRSVTNHSLFESWLSKNSKELLFAHTVDCYSLLGQPKEKSHVLKSCNFKHEQLWVQQQFMHRSKDNILSFHLNPWSLKSDRRQKNYGHSTSIRKWQKCTCTCKCTNSYASNLTYSTET